MFFEKLRHHRPNSFGNCLKLQKKFIDTWFSENVKNEGMANLLSHITGIEPKQSYVGLIYAYLKECHAAQKSFFDSLEVSGVGTAAVNAQLTDILNKLTWFFDLDEACRGKLYYNLLVALLIDNPEKNVILSLLQDKGLR